jgi:hypothetical protein
MVHTKKLKMNAQNHLFDQGKKAWEQTHQFEKQLATVRQELSEKYQPLLLAEKNWFKRIFIKVRFLLELQKKRNEISSWKNLHLIAH